MLKLKNNLKVIKWLIFGLEIPFLSLFGIFIGQIILFERLEFVGEFIGMIIGSLIGMIIGVYILYYVAKRQYSKEVNN